MKKRTVPKLIIVAVGMLIVLSACALNREAIQAYDKQRQVPMQLPPFSGTWLTQSGIKVEPFMSVTPKEPWQQGESARTWGERFGLEPYVSANPREQWQELETRPAMGSRWGFTPDASATSR